MSGHNSRGPLKLSGVGSVALTPGGARHVPQASGYPAASANGELAHSAEWELVEDLPLDLVDDSPWQPEAEYRYRYEPEGIDDLAHTIASEGQLEPMQVRRVGSRYEIIAGHRRKRALRSIGRTTGRAFVMKMTDEEAERALMVHNEGVKGDPDYRKAKRYQRALDAGFAKTQDAVALMFATKQGTVSKCLKMLKLPLPIRALLDKTPDLFGVTTSGVIHDLLAAYPDEIELVTKAVERIKTEKADESSIKAYVMQMIQARTKTEPKQQNVRVISDAQGRSLYTAKLTGRVITVRLEETKVDPDTLLAGLTKYLQEKQATEAGATPAAEGAEP